MVPEAGAGEVLPADGDVEREVEALVPRRALYIYIYIYMYIISMNVSVYIYIYIYVYPVPMFHRCFCHVQVAGAACVAPLVAARQIAAAGRTQIVILLPLLLLLLIIIIIITMIILLLLLLIIIIIIAIMIMMIIATRPWAGSTRRCSGSRGARCGTPPGHIHTMYIHTMYMHTSYIHNTQHVCVCVCKPLTSNPETPFWC